MVEHFHGERLTNETLKLDVIRRDLPSSLSSLMTRLRTLWKTESTNLQKMLEEKKKEGTIIMEVWCPGKKKQMEVLSVIFKVSSWISLEI